MMKGTPSLGEEAGPSVLRRAKVQLLWLAWMNFAEERVLLSKEWV